jgi:hypothetical protein
MIAGLNWTKGGFREVKEGGSRADLSYCLRFNGNGILWKRVAKTARAPERGSSRFS